MNNNENNMMNQQTNVDNNTNQQTFGTVNQQNVEVMYQQPTVDTTNQTNNQFNNINNNVAPKTSVEGNTFIWAVVGFLFPLIGLILFFVWRNSKPSASKSSLKGAIVKFVLGFILTILLTVLGFATLPAILNNVNINHITDEETTGSSIVGYWMSDDENTLFAIDKSELADTYGLTFISEEGMSFSTCTYDKNSFSVDGEKYNYSINNNVLTFEIEGQKYTLKSTTKEKFEKIYNELMEKSYQNYDSDYYSGYSFDDDDDWY